MLSVIYIYIFSHVCTTDSHFILSFSFELQISSNVKPVCGTISLPQSFSKLESTSLHKERGCKERNARVTRTNIVLGTVIYISGHGQSGELNNGGVPQANAFFQTKGLLTAIMLTRNVPEYRAIKVMLKAVSTLDAPKNTRKDVTFSHSL